MKNYIALLILILFYSENTVGQDVDKRSKSIPLHIREVPRHNLMLDAGIVESMGDYADIARSGLNINVGYDYYFHKNMALSTNLRHAYNEFGVNLSAQQDVSVDDRENYSITAVTAGIHLSTRKNRFQMDGFARGGMAYIESPDKVVLFLGDIIGFRSDVENTKDTAGYAEFGLRFNFYFRKEIQLYFTPMYSTTFSKPLAYTLTTNERSNITNLHLNIGVKIAVGDIYSNGEKSDRSLSDKVSVF